MAKSVETFKRALSALEVGNTRDAERLFKKLLRTDPGHVAGLNLLAVLLMQRGEFHEAEPYLRLAIKGNSRSDVTHYNYGIVLKALNRPNEAVEQFAIALALNPKVAETWNSRGAVLNTLGRYQQAIADFDKSISINPNYAEAYCNKAGALVALKSYDQALAAVNTSLSIKPKFAEALLAYGNVLFKLKRFRESLAAYDDALAAKPDLGGAWIGRGNALVEIGSYPEALAAYDKAIALQQHLAKAWLGRGNVFYALRRFDQANGAYDKALTFKPDLAEARWGRGNVFAAQRHCEKAVIEYSKARQLEPALDFIDGTLLNQKLLCCDWSNIESEIEQLLLRVRQQKLVAHPFNLLPVTSSAADQYQCAKSFVADHLLAPAFRDSKAYVRDRIHVAYISADFGVHPVAYLTAGMFEHHDKSRFETTAISLIAHNESDIKHRIRCAVEHFVDVEQYSDEELAALIHARQINILVDLTGYTKNNRFPVLARRPAPVQVSYLGYASTTGAAFVDYILADRTVIPEDHFRFFSEHVVWLPDAFQVNDSKRPVPKRMPTRSECGLPDHGFVFCCFNQTMKILPPVFDVWMRVMRAVDGSVLWLSQANATAAANLRHEAQRRGIGGDRLIFAERTASLTDHIARHRQADLFLDTLPYNAHATASDALWAGTPLLTCIGSTFAGRVGASLLKAIDLGELITSSLTEYETLGLKIAHDPSYLAALKGRISRNRSNRPLFDTYRFTRHIERAYLTMWERYQRGEAPTAFAIKPII